jgi:ribosomal subunit interface protein
MTELELVVRGRNADVSSKFQELAEDKLERIDRFGVQIQRIDLEVSKESNPRLADRAFQVELTCRGRGPVVRAEANAADEYSALDLAIGRLEQQLRRAHDRTKIVKGGLHRSKSVPDGIDVGAAGSGPEKSAAASDEFADTYQADADEVFAKGPVVVRDKTHPTVPMSIEQAVTEMELVGHDFFLFEDEASGGAAVVYRRRGYDYGLIRIDTANREN